MSTLPTGGKSQTNPAPTQTQEVANTRTVRIERLQKMSVEQLEAKIAALPAKLKRKSEVIEKRIAQMRDKLAVYTDFKQKEVDVCRRLAAEKKKAAPAPNAGQPVPAKAA